MKKLKISGDDLQLQVDNPRWILVRPHVEILVDNLFIFYFFDFYPIHAAFIPPTPPPGRNFGFI